MALHVRGLINEDLFGVLITFSKETGVQVGGGGGACCQCCCIGCVWGTVIHCKWGACGGGADVVAAASFWAMLSLSFLIFSAVSARFVEVNLMSVDKPLSFLMIG